MKTLPDTAAAAVLAIETSVPSASVALSLDGAVAYQMEFTCGRNHNSMVFEPLAEALGMLGGRKLDHVLVGTGPGSYSGTRTGIAVGQGVAITHGCAAVGIGSLAATPVSRAAAMAAGDARRGLYFTSRITATGEAEAPELMDAAAFESRLGEYCAANAAASLFTLDDPSGPWLAGIRLPAEIVSTRPSAAGLLAVWSGLSVRRRDELAGQPLAPTYLRPPFTSKAKPGHPLLRRP